MEPMTPLQGAAFLFLFGFSFAVPWIFVRIGLYKSWYLAPAMPPLIWGKAIYGWPIGLMFVSLPFIYLFGLRGDEGLSVAAFIGVLGVILAIIMIVWTPSWAKPAWQRYLETNYTWREVRGVFIPAWRKMDPWEWSAMMDTEEGIEELIKQARQS